MPTIRTNSTSKGMLWAGRVITMLVALFLLFDSSIKILKVQAAVEGTAQIGFPRAYIVPIGIALLVSLVVYLIPRSSILGAILLTGYLGGATAATVRMQNPWFVFPVIIGALVWGGIYFRDQRLRQLLPLRS